MNSILESVIAACYDDGWRLFQSLPIPTPLDERWAGFCLFNLQRPLEARELLLRARGRGCEAAVIELATVHRHLGENETARAVLSSFDAARATAFDQALAAREQGVIEYTAGDLLKASESFEIAWAAALRSPEGSVLVSSIAFMLGRTLADQGHAQRALYHLDTALASANLGQRISILAVRTECLIYLGRFNAANDDLENALSAVHHSPAARPVLHYFRALLSRARGQYRDAEDVLRVATQSARDANEPETELYAELEACAVAACLDQPARARAHLSRARLLAPNVKARALVDWREGMILAFACDPRAIPVLERSLRAFEGLVLERECGWVRLTLGEACLRLGREAQAEEWLNAATDTRYGLGESAALWLELRSLRSVLEYLERLPPEAYPRVLYDDLCALAGGAPLQLGLRTLGQVGLLAGRDKLRLNAGMAVSAEILSYLLTHPGRSLERILADVFPDVLPDKAKNYFHLVRNEFKRAVRGASIPFDETTRTYAVDLGGLHLDWDRAELLRSLSLGGIEGLRRALKVYKGAFLPHSENEWAVAERTNLEWGVVKLGIEVIDQRFKDGEFSACLELTERLLEIEPLNEAVSSYMVRATKALKGVMAAQCELERLEDRFISEVGETPPSLERLKRDLLTIH